MSKNLPVVVIDPGHGGNQPVGGSSPNNATGPNGLLEKNLTLDIAQRVKSLLADSASVILTRASDTNLSLADRAKVARDNSALLFLSIHLNGFSDIQVDGTEVWVAHKASQRSRRFAQTVLKHLLAITDIPDRGVRESNLGTLLPSRHTADTAACLAELSFLTNPEQAQKLASAEYRQKLAQALAAAINQEMSSSSSKTQAAQSLAAAIGGYGSLPHEASW